MTDDLTKSIFQEVKKELEVLEEQFYEGRKELEEAYQQKKKILSALVKKVHNYVSSIEKKGSDELGVLNLQKNSKDLLEALDSDFDFSYTEFEDTTHDLKRALHGFEESLDSYYKELGFEEKKDKKSFEAEIRHAIAQFKKELAHQKLFCKQITEQSFPELEIWKTKSLNDIRMLKQRIDSRINQAKLHTGKFQQEMGEAYETLKSAFDEMKPT